MRHLPFRLLLISALAVSAAGPVQPTRRAAAAPNPPASPAWVSQLIVKFAGLAPAAVTASAVSALSAAAGVPLSYGRPMLLPGAHVLRLPQAVPAAEAQRLAARLAGQPGVAYAVPEHVYRPVALPNDQVFTAAPLHDRWTWVDPVGGLNASAAWDVVTDTSQVVVAVLDTGILTDHVELPAERLLPGYDFITADFAANDNDPPAGLDQSRDADPSDPGDWVTQADINSVLACSEYTAVPTNSSWHGTLVTGLIAARGNNVYGIAGLAWGGVRILPVRVMGKCGGAEADIIDGMLWAAGVGLSGASNPHPAQILNLSLGASATACSLAYQDALALIQGAGKIVVAAAGNDLSAVNAPANCPGVLAVGGHDSAGALSDFGAGLGSSYGPEIALSAPGGKVAAQNDVIYSTSNSYTQTHAFTPDGSVIVGSVGTSLAAPLAAGVAALVWAANRDLSAARVSEILTTTARAFPIGSDCLTTYAGQCGAGLLDAGAAVNAARPTLTALSPLSVTAGSASFTLTITGTQFVSPTQSLAGAQVLWNGAALTTHFVNATTLTATVPSAKVVALGSAQISVANPGAGAGPVITTTTTLAFTIAAAPATPTATTPPPSATTPPPSATTPPPGTPTPPPNHIYLPAIVRGP